MNEGINLLDLPQARVDQAPDFYLGIDAKLGLARFPAHQVRRAPLIRPTWCGVGDSITKRVLDSSATTIYFGITGYMTWANILLGGRLRIIANKGVSGDKINNVIARLTDILSTNADIYTVMLGINDVTNDADTIDNNIAGLQYIYETLLSTGSLLHVCTVLPSTVINTNARKRKWHLLNAFIRGYAYATRGVLLSDTAAAWTDPATTNPASGMASDGTHPSPLGATQLGRCIYETFNAFLPVSHYTWAINNDFGNLVYNGMMNGNNASGTNGFVLGTGITGTGPDGWRTLRSGTGTGVASKVARTDWRQGAWARMALTAAADNDSAQFEIRTLDNTTRANTTAYTLGQRASVSGITACQFVATTAGTSASSPPAFDTTIGNTTVDGTVTWTAVDAFNPGDKVFAQAAFQSSNFSGAAHIEMFVLCLDAGSSTLLTAYANFIAGEVITALTFVPSAGVWRTPDFEIPPLTTRIYLRLKAAGAAGVIGNLDVTNVELRKVT